MPRAVEITGQAERDLRRLGPMSRERIREALGRLVATDLGDVKRVEGRAGEWRLRVGDLRVLFRREGDFDSGTLVVLRVRPRDQAYRD